MIGKFVQTVRAAEHLLQIPRADSNPAEKIETMRGVNDEVSSFAEQRLRRSTQAFHNFNIIAKLTDSG